MMSTNKVCTTPQRTYCAGGGGTTTTTTTLRRAPAFDAGHKPATAVFGSGTATTPIPPSPFQPMFSRCMMLSPSHDDDGEDDEEETHGIFRATKQPHHQHHHFEQEQSKMYPRDQDSSHSKPPTNQDSIRGSTASTEGRYRGNVLVNHVTDVFKALPKLDWYTRDITASTAQGGTTTRSEKSRHPSPSSKSKPCSSSRLDQDRDQHAPSTAGAAPRRSTTAATSTTATGHRIHKIRTNQDDRSRPIPSKETTPQRSDDALSLVNLLREANFGFTSSATGTTSSTANQYLYREDSIRTEQPSPQPRVQHRPTNVRFGSRQPPREQGVGFRGDSSKTNQNAFPIPQAILPDTTSTATGGGGTSSTRTARTSSKCTTAFSSSHLQQPSPRVQDSRRKDCGGTCTGGPATAWYAINPVVASQRLTNTKTLSRAEGNLNKSHNKCHNTTQCTTTSTPYIHTDTNMMTSTRRNIYNLHRNASDPEFDEDGLASRQGEMSTHQTRPRSRAIAIRRNTRSTKAMARNNSDTTVTSSSSPEDEDDSMQQMYDYATWRLYHRIVDHRMKHPLTQSYYDLNAAAEAANAAKANCDASPSLREQDPSSSIPHAASYYYYNGVMMPVVPPPTNLQDKIYDGEVFDLEL